MELEKLKKYTINLYDLLGALIEYGQHDKQFKLGDIIKYDPVSVVEIAREFLDEKMKCNPDCEDCNPDYPAECQLCRER